MRILKSMLILGALSGLLLSSQATVFAIDNQINEVKLQIQEQFVVQEKAHTLAESARALGLAEDDAIILRAQEIWHNAESEKVGLIDLQTKLEEQKRLEEEKKKQEEERKARMEYVGVFKLTGYCPCYSCSEGYGRQTASGKRATEGVTVAADRRVLPLGTRIYIEGVGERVVQDVGGAIKQNKLDIYVENHSDCYKPAYNTSAKVYILK